MRYLHNTDIEVKFYNDRVERVIAASEISQPFTYVPIKAGHMELVGGNAIVFGDITEGRDMINPVVETEYLINDRAGEDIIIPLVIGPYLTATVYSYPGTIIWVGGATYAPGTRVYVGTIYYECMVTNTDMWPPANPSVWLQLPPSSLWIQRTLYGVLALAVPSPVYEGSKYYVHITNSKLGIDKIAFYEAIPGDSVADVTDGLNTALAVAGFDVEGHPFQNVLLLYGANGTFNQQNPYEVGTIEDVYKDWTYEFYILSAGYVIKYPHLKSGAVHAFGLVYKDLAGRRCSIMKPDEFNIYLPFYDDNSVLLSSTFDIKFKLRHQPPAWADTYEIVYFGNISMDFWLQMRADSIIGIGSDRYLFNIQETITYTRDKNDRWKVPDYVWQTGDRLRLVCYIDNDDGDLHPYDILYDYEIEQIQTDYGEAIGGDFLICQAVEHPADFAGKDNIIVEVYRPRKGIGDVIAYGSGMVFKTGVDDYGNRYHKGDVDQIINGAGETTTAAEVYNLANDCWKFLRLNFEHATSDILPFWAESIAPSDWWENQTKLTSMGWPFLYDENFKETRMKKRFRNGGFMLVGTQTNNIAKFTYEDFVDMPERGGQITGLRQIGFTLKVLQLHKETSIYINRIQTFNPDGTEQFTLIDNLIGTQRPMDKDYGCQHPDSVMVNNDYLYYWDQSEGKFIRSAPNGQVEISDIKMKRWFKDLLLWINQNGGSSQLLVCSGANNEHNEIWVVFQLGESVQGAIFSESQGRWISRLNQTTESYVHLGNFFAHMHHQKLYIMNLDEGQPYLTWSGIEVVAEIEFPSNIIPSKNKIYNAVALYSDHQMDCPSRYIIIPVEASYAEMESYIAVWNKSEGIYYGRILKDQNSPGVFNSENHKTMNGREMRGRYCLVRLQTSERSEKVRIDSAIVLSTPSERSA